MKLKKCTPEKVCQQMSNFPAGESLAEFAARRRRDEIIFCCRVYMTEKTFRIANVRALPVRCSNPQRT